MLITRLLKRSLEVLIVGFALYGFAAVRLGERTAFEHLSAVLSTPEAARAGQELRGASARCVERLREEMSRPPRSVRGRPELPRFGVLEAPPAPPRVIRQMGH